MKEVNCICSILVGYNVFFDWDFVNVVVNCNGIKCNLFYFFFCFDIVIIGGLVVGQMVLVKVCCVVYI